MSKFLLPLGIVFVVVMLIYTLFFMKGPASATPQEPAKASIIYTYFSKPYNNSFPVQPTLKTEITGKKISFNAEFVAPEGLEKFIKVKSKTVDGVTYLIFPIEISGLAKKVNVKYDLSGYIDVNEKGSYVFQIQDSLNHVVVETPVEIQ